MQTPIFSPFANLSGNDGYKTVKIPKKWRRFATCYDEPLLSFGEALFGERVAACLGLELLVCADA